MENKILSRSLFGLSVLIFIITFYFFYGMMSNGKPADYDPDQMGAELYQAGQADNSNYRTLGQEAFDKQIKTINTHIYSGLTFLNIVFGIAGVLMIIFLIYGVVTTAISDVRKALPSIIFCSLTLLTLLIAFLMAGDSAEGFQNSVDKIIAKEGQSAGGFATFLTNFSVIGLFVIIIPGVALLVIDLVKDIIKGLAK